MPRAEYLKSGNISEHTIQKTIVDWLRLHKIIHASIPNEAANNPITGRRLKERGLRKGASDLFICRAAHGFHGMWLEIKSKEGMLSQEQKKFFQDVENEKYFTSACWSIDEGISILKWYLHLK